MGDENAEGKNSKIFSANTFESMWISRNWMSMLTNIFNVFACRASKSAVRYWFRCSFCSVTLIDATRCLSNSQLTDGFTVEHEQIFANSEQCELLNNNTNASFIDKEKNIHYKLINGNYLRTRSTYLVHSRSISQSHVSPVVYIRLEYINFISH